MTEPVVQDIQVLFNKDPLQLTEDDITAIITKFRSSRDMFNAGNMKAGSTKVAKPSKDAIVTNISLSDLGL
jgi:hypothetical protein